MTPKDEGNQAVRNEGFIEDPDEDIMVDDPDRIAQYRAVGLAEGAYQVISAGEGNLNTDAGQSHIRRQSQIEGRNINE
jgi:hypothetical protein